MFAFVQDSLFNGYNQNQLSFVEPAMVAIPTLCFLGGCTCALLSRTEILQGGIVAGVAALAIRVAAVALSSFSNNSHPIQNLNISIATVLTLYNLQTDALFSRLSVLIVFPLTFRLFYSY